VSPSTILSPFSFSSSFTLSLTLINAFPNKFCPQRCRLNPALSGANPTPQIRSSGLASTSSLSPVASSLADRIAASLEMVTCGNYLSSQCRVYLRSFFFSISHRDGGREERCQRTCIPNLLIKLLDLSAQIFMHLRRHSFQHLSGNVLHRIHCHQHSFVWLWREDNKLHPRTIAPSALCSIIRTSATIVQSP